MDKYIKFDTDSKKTVASGHTSLKILEIFLLTKKWLIWYSIIVKVYGFWLLGCGTFVVFDRGRVIMYCARHGVGNKNFTLCFVSTDLYISINNSYVVDNPERSGFWRVAKA